MKDYNTQREPLILKEYGRNVQKLAKYISTVDDEEKKGKYAHTLVDLMKQINPTLKDYPEYNQKLWDDLFIMSEFVLDVEDAPYPKPSPDVLTKKPETVKYNTNRLRFKHYGRNIELLIQQAIAIEDETEKEEAVIYIGKLMKTFFAVWNREVVEDSVILKNIHQLSGDKLTIDIERVTKEGLFEVLYRDKSKSHSHSHNKKRNHSSNYKKRKG